MDRRMIGFVSSLEHDDIASLHKATAIFTRKEAVPPRYGRARVFSIAPEAGAGHFWLRECGVMFVFGADDAKIARMMRAKSAGVKRMIVVLKTKPKVKSRVSATKTHLEKKMNIDTNIVTVKASGDLFHRIYATGGKESMEPHDHSAPSIPRAKVTQRPVRAPRTPRKSD